jgi:hypothetical protein
MSIHADTKWTRMVRENLRQGFGVEDIAHESGSPVASVRREVMLLRAEGHLKTMFSGSCACSAGHTLKTLAIRRPK